MNPLKRHFNAWKPASAGITDIKCFMVIPVQAGIQKNKEILTV